MSEIKYITIGEFAKRIGVTPQTLRNWEKEKYLIPSYVTEGKTRYYSEELYQSFVKERIDKTNDKSNPKIIPKDTKQTGVEQVNEKEKVSIIGYVYDKDKEKMAEKERLLLNYMTSNGYQFDLIVDNAEGNETYIQLLTKLLSYSVTKVVMLTKADMLKYPINLIEHICTKQNVVIEIVNTEISPTQELTKEEIIEEITSLTKEMPTESQDKLSMFISNLVGSDKL